MPGVSRVTYNSYGISKKQYKKMKEMCKEGKYIEEIKKAAGRTNRDIAEYLIKSVTEGKSYDTLEFDNKLGRIPCGRTDFYAFRRLFYFYLKQELNNVSKMDEPRDRVPGG